ncbi:MAG: M23 family metallopeptidase [Sphingomonadales bacterium]|nr:M23 family metallopeptidase [Sphingomonadales bacterium]
MTGSMAAALLLAGWPAAASEDAPPALAVPIDCRPGVDCFVQQLFDHDATAGARDFRCGGRTYDGHDGTDIRLPSIAAMRRGVAVLAAADGTVLAVRDGEADHLVATAADRAAMRGRECGNGVLIGHSGGWQTQYCHMAKGSIGVRQGAVVMAGARLGLVGLSGDTQFPHVHLAVRQGGRKLDPYAPGLVPGKCGSGGGKPLWTPAAAAALAWKGAEVINIGFAPAPVSMADVEEQRAPAASTNGAALVFYGRAIGLAAGDNVSITIEGPAGDIMARSETVIDHDKAQWLGLAGRRTPPQGWPHGSYQGRFTVTRNGLIVAARRGVLAL